LAVQAGFGMQELRAMSQWKPAPQSLSAPQKPPSAQVPSAQKHPAAHCLSSAQAEPGGRSPPLGPLELSLEPK
jgi:hypothetical protein